MQVPNRAAELLHTPWKGYVSRKILQTNDDVEMEAASCT